MTHEEFWDSFGSVYKQMDKDLAGEKLLDGPEMKSYLQGLAANPALPQGLRAAAVNYNQSLIERGLIK